MPIAAGAQINVTYKGQMNQQRYMLTLWYSVVDTESANSVVQDLGTIAGYFSLQGVGSVLNRYLTALPENYTVDFVQVQQVAPVRSVYVTNDLGLSGEYAGVASTGNLQCPVTLHTANGGRNQIAVKKIGPVPDAGFSAAQPTVAYKAILSNLGTALISGQITLAPAITLLPIVKHPTTGVGDLIIGARIPTRIGTMRRRTLRVGE